jgi:hypothetical protein
VLPFDSCASFLGWIGRRRLLPWCIRFSEAISDREVSGDVSTTSLLGVDISSGDPKCWHVDQLPSQLSRPAHGPEVLGLGFLPADVV